MVLDRFATLKNQGMKVAEVHQSDHVARLRQRAPTLPDGGCAFSHENYRHLEHGIGAGLTVDWLKEKLTTSNPAFSPASKAFVRSTGPGRIAQIMHAPGASRVDSRPRACRAKRPARHPRHRHRTSACQTGKGRASHSSSADRPGLRTGVRGNGARNRDADGRQRP